MASNSYSRRNHLLQKVTEGIPAGKVYDEWASNYDQDVENYVKPGEDFERLFDQVDTYFRDNKNTRILDVGAGTGYGGKKLKERGYTNVDGVDPSDQMLQIARESDIYNKTYCCFIGESPIPVSDDSYDCTVCLNSIAPKHIPAIGLLDVIRVIKPGGYVMIQGNYEAWLTDPEYNEKTEAIIKQLCDEHRLEKIQQSILPEYDHVDGSIPRRGILLVYRKL